MKYMDARKLVTHPVAGIDCHDPDDVVAYHASCVYLSENSMGFHADQYSVKSLAEAINFWDSDPCAKELTPGRLR